MEIPGYKLGREVQAGQVYTTYNALDVVHSKTVIVRVFNETLSRNPAFQDHFRDVTERLVDQPLSNNVDYLDAIVTDNACVIVTNYCHRTALQQEDFPDFSEAKVLDIGVQLAASLSQLHNLGIVHGGVELSNISFLESGEVVLETVAPQRTMPGHDAPRAVSQNLQDAACLAPEAHTGLTVSSDFYSLGVVLYELLLGRKPFNTETLEEMEQQKRAGQYLPLTGELAHLKPLFNGLLSPDPTSRIASNEQFVRILNACRNGAAASGYASPATPASMEPAGPSARPRAVARQKKAGRRPLVFAAVPAVVVAAGVIVYMLSGRQEAPQDVLGERQSPVVSETPAPTTEAPPIAQATDRAVPVEPENDAAKTLKNDTTAESKARSDVAVAEQQVADEEPVTPPGENVIETDQRAADAARDAEERERKAREYAANRQAEQQRAEQRRTAALAEQQRIAALAEQRRLEQERIARAAEAERLAAQQREIAARNAEIDRRLTTADQQLARRPLSWSALETAESEYRVLLTIAEGDSRVSSLFWKIVDSHLVLANIQKSAAQLSESMETTNRGLALDGENRELLALRNEIANAMKELEEEKDEIPVIGTF